MHGRRPSRATSIAAGARRPENRLRPAPAARPEGPAFEADVEAWDFLELRGEAPRRRLAARSGVFLFFGDELLSKSNLDSVPIGGLLFVWILGVILWCAFGVIVAADHLAEMLGEPYGTLILTFRSSPSRSC